MLIKEEVVLIYVLMKFCYITILTRQDYNFKVQTEAGYVTTGTDDNTEQLQAANGENT